VSEYAQIELIHSLPALLIGIAALGSMVISLLTYRASVKTRLIAEKTHEEVKAVKTELNGLLEGRDGQQERSTLTQRP
jgi:hypothetical protein